MSWEGKAGCLRSKWKASSTLSHSPLSSRSSLAISLLCMHPPPAKLFDTLLLPERFPGQSSPLGLTALPSIMYIDMNVHPWVPHMLQSIVLPLLLPISFIEVLYSLYMFPARCEFNIVTVTSMNHHNVFTTPQSALGACYNVVLHLISFWSFLDHIWISCNQVQFLRACRSRVNLQDIDHNLDWNLNAWEGCKECAKPYTLIYKSISLLDVIMIVYGVLVDEMVCAVVFQVHAVQRM